MAKRNCTLIWGNDDEEETRINKKQKKDSVIYDPLIYACDGVIHFSSPINKITIELVIKLISKTIEKFYKDNDSGEQFELTYVVDTPGGSVDSILKFVDFIGLTKSKHPNVTFTSVISGLVASAGTIMCVVADKRYMTKNAHAMIHELSSGKSGRYTQVVAHTDFLKEIHNCLINIYLKNIKISREKIEVLLKNDTWYNAEQYLAEGFIHGIK
jgi:ATP-dependent protease ClpP protease subunit